jgi:phosphohistidine swiveling domain-containing protein
MNVLRKFMQTEAQRLKPLLDMAYGAIVRYQREPTPANEASLRAALEPVVAQLMVFRPYMPAYKQADFDTLESVWRELTPGDAIMLFDHCVDIMHLRLSRDLTANEEQQPWSPELREILDQRRRAPAMTAVEGDFLAAGVGAAPGRARGPARVVRRDEDLAALRPGEILVCVMSTTEWVTAIGRVAGIVADQGGMACHAAIVAREIGLPCVTGCRNATVTIETGQMIEIDGDLGMVTRPPEKMLAPDAATRGSTRGRHSGVSRERA